MIHHLSMGKEQLRPIDKDFIERQWECTQHELNVLWESEAFNYLSGLHYNLGSIQQESTLYLSVQSPVATHFEEKFMEKDFAQKYEAMLSEAEILTNGGYGPLTSISLYYNPVWLSHIRGDKKAELIGSDELRVTAYPDSSLQIIHAQRQKRKGAVVIDTNMRHTIPEQEWRTEQSPLFDLLAETYEQYPSR